MNQRQSDFEWLQQFARAGNQSAFRDLVRRHIDLVFATALRRVGDAGGAEEISQNVFSALARKAWQFAPDDSLPAWLHKTALLESQAWLRGEMRRRRREQTAAELGTTMKTPEAEPAFRALVPLLDEALLSLREKDRTALLLRYCESQSLKDVGEALGVSDDTAQKRVQSALEKLSQFFQRRGFKTATVAATTAALQHTVSSASSATVATVFHAAVTAAPPALGGLTLLFARFASLSKLQTAAVCVVVAAAPVTWQAMAQRDAKAELAEAKNRMVATQNELTLVQTEIERLTESTIRFEESIARAQDAAARQAETAQRFAAWKESVRVRLFANDYAWPDDLPFVRIPKSMVPRMQVHRPISHPGVLKQEARELLGLTPEEREQVEASLQKHFATLDQLMEANRYATNHATMTTLPKNAIASQVVGLPALGAEAVRQGENLQAILQAVLGNERWALVAEDLKSSGTDTLRRVLGLDAGERGQELAVWVQERDGNLVVGYSWGDRGSTFSQSGLALSFLLPDVEFPIAGGSVEGFLGFGQLPATLTRPTMEWLRQQAVTRLEKKGEQ